MRHWAVRGFSAAIWVALLLSGPLRAQNDTRQQARALIERAREVSDIRSDHNVPFRLRARVRLLDQLGGVVEGIYQEIWSSSERWRQDITFPGFSQVLVHAADKMWWQGNMRYRPYRVFQFTQTLRFPLYLRLRLGETVREIRGLEQNGLQTTCAQLQTTTVLDQQTTAPRDRKFCFDAETGTLVRQEYSNTVWEYADYAGLGNKLFPRTLRHLESGQPLIEIRVEELASGFNPDPTLFTPPSGAELQEWCENPEPPRILLQPRPRYPKGARRAGVGGHVRVYLVVGRDGKAHNPTVVESPAPEFDVAMLKALRGWRFRPSMCRGKPIDAVTFVELEFKVL